MPYVYVFLRLPVLHWLTLSDYTTPLPSLPLASPACTMLQRTYHHHELHIWITSSLLGFLALEDGTDRLS
jgi:hypothetical protein